VLMQVLSESKSPKTSVFEPLSGASFDLLRIKCLGKCQ
jgi:hypothetical protein